MSDLTIGRGRFMLGDCLERMAELRDASVDMILCDLPYGTTACNWDSVIPFEPLWKEYWRIAKPNAAVALTASQPFTYAVIKSDLKRFRYEWIWEKSRATGFQLSKKMPMKKHENILVFYKKLPTYNPQGLVPSGKRNRRGEAGNGGHLANECNDYIQEFTNYPTSVLRFSNETSIHPTQKPVALFEYLIRTYTDESMTVLDNCAGSGTTAIAAERAGRNWICIERDQTYFDKACERVRNEVESRGLFA